MYCYKVTKKKSPFYVILIIIVVLVIVGMGFFSLVNLNKRKNDVQYNIVKTGIIEEEINNNKKQDDISDIIEKVTPCVVGISSVKVDGLSIFTSDGSKKWGAGTGFIVSSNGYIVTNQHVAGKKGTKTNVTLENGNSYIGSTVWADEDIDLAIVKINENGLDYVIVGDSSSIKVGQTVYAIGNPIGFEFQRTVTSGIISAKNRTIKIDDSESSSYMEDLIQTDASINSGNSGGPLINNLGQVIGINTVKISEAEGIGFAVPINLVKPIIQKFVTEGNFKEPYIGIFAYDRQVIPYMDSNIKLEKGIYVAKVDSYGPAEKAGIKVGDIITQIEGNAINTMVDLRCLIYTKNPGDKINFTIIRNNKEKQVEIVLKSKQ